MSPENEEKDVPTTVAQDVLDFLGDEVPEHFEELLDDFTEEPFEAPEVEEEEAEVDPDAVIDPNAEVVLDPDAEVVADDAIAKPEVKKDEVVPVVDEVTPATPAVETPAIVVDPAVAAMQEQITKLMGQIETLQTPQAPAAEEETPNTLTQAEVYDFVGDQDLDAILSDKTQFNTFLSGVINSAMNTAVAQVHQGLPSAVSAQVQQQNGMQIVVDGFYKENADLLPVRKTVGTVSNAVAQEHPDFTLEQVFEETAKRTREMFGLTKGEVKVVTPETVVKTPVKKPALPSKGGARGGETGKKLIGQDKHINDVL